MAGIFRTDGNAVLAGINFDPRLGEALFAPRTLHRVHFYFWAVPARDVNGAVDVLDRKTPLR